MFEIFKYGKKVDIDCLLCGKNKADFDIQMQTANGIIYCNLCKVCLEKTQKEFAKIKIDWFYLSGSNLKLNSTAELLLVMISPALTL